MATRMQKVDDTEVIVETPKATKPKTKKFADSDYILCHSVTSGGLNVTCKSGSYYEFKNYGSDCEIEYRDLVTLIRNGSEHIFLPRFVIDDEDFLAQFPQITQLYSSLYTSKDLNAILDLPLSQMTEEIKTLPVGAQNNLKSLAASAVANGRIDSVKKIRALADIFGSDFNLLSELFG